METVFYFLVSIRPFSAAEHDVLRQILQHNCIPSEAVFQPFASLFIRANRNAMPKILTKILQDAKGWLREYGCGAGAKLL